MNPTAYSGLITVLNPTAPPRELRHALAPRLPDLSGKTIGFLWNSKPNGDLLFGRLEELLRQKYEISDVIYRRKSTASIPAPESDLNHLAATTQAVVVGLAD